MFVYSTGENNNLKIINHVTNGIDECYLVSKIIHMNNQIWRFK